MFTIRVYGICLRSIGGGTELLVMDEIIKGRRITKFPGGGLEYGEGTKDCLIREIREELNAEAIEVEHFYTTDFFQQSIFHTDPMQVIGIYYKFKLAGGTKLELLKEPFGFVRSDQKEGCRWIALEEEDPFSLPIDKLVFAELRKQHADR